MTTATATARKPRTVTKHGKPIQKIQWWNEECYLFEKIEDAGLIDTHTHFIGPDGDKDFDWTDDAGTIRRGHVNAIEV